MTILSLFKRAKTLKTDAVTFERLDYWTMLELFERIPVHDLVRLNGLAPWWSGYVDKVCLTSRSITVQCSNEPDQSSQDDLLKVTTIDSAISDRLGQLLPNITSLELYIGGSQPFTIDDITYLISQWSHKLAYLKLICYSNFVPVDGDTYDDNQQFYGLLLSLNCIATLRELIIFGDSRKCALIGSIDMPILAQLTCFCFRCGENDFINLRDNLVQYAAPNVALPNVWIFFVWFNYMYDDLELHESQLLSKLQIVEMGHVNARHEWSLFPNVVFSSYLIKPNSLSTFMELISGMQSLEHMTTLCLDIVISPQFDRNVGQVLPNRPQFPTVTELLLKLVTWDSPTSSYSAFSSLQLNLNMFPNVTSVHLLYTYLDEVPRAGGAMVKWMAKTWIKISIAIWYCMVKRLVRQSFPGVECTFELIINCEKGMVRMHRNLARHQFDRN